MRRGQDWTVAVQTVDANMHGIKIRQVFLIEIGEDVVFRCRNKSTQQANVGIQIIQE